VRVPRIQTGTPMSGVQRKTLRAVASLACSRCDARWESAPYDTYGWCDQEEQARPALEAGWSVFVGKRTTHTYCPDHGPSTPMHLVLGPGGINEYQHEATQ